QHGENQTNLLIPICIPYNQPNLSTIYLLIQNLGLPPARRPSWPTHAHRCPHTYSLPQLPHPLLSRDPPRLQQRTPVRGGGVSHRALHLGGTTHGWDRQCAPVW